MNSIGESACESTLDEKKSLSMVKSGSLEITSTTEWQMKSVQSFSRSSVEALFAILDNDRTNEKAEMVRLNQHLAEIAGRLHLMESETVFVEIIANIKDFAKLFDTLVAGERTEIERLKGQLKTIEAEKLKVAENLSVEKLREEEFQRTIEQYKTQAEKTNKDMSLLREENQKLKVESAMLTERRQADEKRIKSLEEELQYARETIEMKDKEISKLIGGVSGISILVSWEARLKAAIANIKKQYEEQLKAIQVLYETRMSTEISEMQIKIKKTMGVGGDQYSKELEEYRKEIYHLKEQLDSKTAYIESMQIAHEKYRKWSEEKLVEFGDNLSLVSSCIRRYNQIDFSLKSEIDNYRFYLEEVEKRIAGIKTFFATVRMQSGSTSISSTGSTSISTTIRDERITIDESDLGRSFSKMIGFKVTETAKDAKDYKTYESEEEECN